MTVRDIRMVMLAFLIIATCGNSHEQRTFARVIFVVCAVILLTMWLVGVVFGIEVH